MSKSYSNLFYGTIGSPQISLNTFALNSTYIPADNGKLDSYSQKGIDIPERIVKMLKKLQNKGDYISDSAGSFSMEDISIMSKQTGVEFACVTIDNVAYLIRGDNRGTVIPSELINLIKEKSGSLDFHSHPHNDDCIPSLSDRTLMGQLEKITGQTTSKIVTPNGKTTIFNVNGVIETGIVSNTLDENRKKALMELFGGVR